MCQRFVAKAEVVNRMFSKKVFFNCDQHCSILCIWQLLHNYSHSRLWDYVQQIHFTVHIYTSVLKASRNTQTHNNNSRSRHKNPIIQQLLCSPCPAYFPILLQAPQMLSDHHKACTPLPGYQYFTCLQSFIHDAQELCFQQKLFSILT